MSSVEHITIYSRFVDFLEIEIESDEKKIVSRLVEVKSTGSQTKLRKLESKNIRQADLQIKTALDVFEIENGKLVIIEVLNIKQQEFRVFSEVSYVNERFLYEHRTLLTFCYIKSILKPFFDKCFEIKLSSWETRRLNSFINNELSKLEPKSGIKTYQELFKRSLIFSKERRPCIAEFKSLFINKYKSE